MRKVISADAHNYAKKRPIPDQTIESVQSLFFFPLYKLNFSDDVTYTLTKSSIIMQIRPFTTNFTGVTETHWITSTYFLSEYTLFLWLFYCLDLHVYFSICETVINSIQHYVIWMSSNSAKCYVFLSNPTEISSLSI